MADVVRAALVQQKWTGDKDSMVKNAVAAIRDAAAQGARVTCLQELFYGPYFCQVQEPEWYSWAEAVPDGPTVRLMCDVAREHQMVLIVPIYEAEQEGIYYNTAAVIDADGTFLGKHRKNHIPQVKGFWEKYYFPEGWRALGLAGAKIVFNPSATSRGLSEYLWRLEQTSAAVANEYYVGTINRVGVEPLGDNDFYGQSYFADPRGQVMGGAASDTAEEVVVRDLDMGLLEEVRHLWQFYRDRRPDSYGPLAQP